MTVLLALLLGGWLGFASGWYAHGARYRAERDNASPRPPGVS